MKYKSILIAAAACACVSPNSFAGPGGGSLDTSRLKAANKTVLPERPLHLIQSVVRYDKNYSKTYLEAAIGSASQQIAQDPKNIAALVTRGFALWRFEQFGRAMVDLEKAVSIRPKLDDPIVFYVLGECYREKDDWTKAFACYSRSIEIRPDIQLFHLRCAQLLVDKKEYEKALPEANFLVQKEKNELWPLEFRAKVRRMAGHYQDAVDDCTKAILMRADVSTIYAERAKCYDKLGKKALADADRKKVDELTRDKFL